MMICKNCGAEILDEENVCSSCGAEIIKDEILYEEKAEKVEITTPIKYSGKGIAGFILSLVGIIIFGLPCAIVGIILSSIALKEINKYNYKGKGLAISGFVISIIDLVLLFLYFTM